MRQQNMDTETRRKIERYRDEAARNWARQKRLYELIMSIATALLEEDAQPRPASHRKPHPHLKLVRGVLIGGAAAAAGRLLAGHRTATAVAALTTAALAAPLVAAPLILSTPAPNAAPRLVHHARRRDPAPPPASRPAATPPARNPAALPVRPARNIPVPAPPPSPSSSPAPPLLPSLLTPPFPPRQCILRLHGLCLRL